MLYLGTVNLFLPEEKYKHFYNAWLLIRQASDKEINRNWYLRRGENIEDIYKKLYENSIDYVTIDFSEYVKSKDDKITILCEDKSLRFIRSMFVPYNNGNKEILIYTVSGHSFSGFNDSAFISPNIAKGILKRKIKSDNHKFTPRRDDLLKIIIYDMCFHEGSNSKIIYEYRESELGNEKYNWALIDKINDNLQLIGSKDKIRKIR